MRISDWSSDVCSSDLCDGRGCRGPLRPGRGRQICDAGYQDAQPGAAPEGHRAHTVGRRRAQHVKGDLWTSHVDRPCRRGRHRVRRGGAGVQACRTLWHRSEEHTSELQSLMRISYAVFCLKKKKNTYIYTTKTDMQDT